MSYTYTDRNPNGGIYERDSDVYMPETYRVEATNDLPYHPRQRELETKFEKAWIDYKRGDIDSDVMWQAKDELKQFLNHSPEERIALLQSEIERLEPQLKTAKKQQASYIQDLLRDPDVAKRRLEQQIKGYEEIAEYTDEQLDKAKKLERQCWEIECLIRDRQRDIERIQQKMQEQQRREAARAAVEEPIKKFNQCLTELKQCLEELKATVAEHDIQFPQQILPGEIVLYEGKKRTGFNSYEPRLEIQIKYGD